MSLIPKEVLRRYFPEGSSYNETTTKSANLSVRLLCERETKEKKKETKRNRIKRRKERRKREKKEKKRERRKREKRGGERRREEEKEREEMRREEEKERESGSFIDLRAPFQFSLVVVSSVLDISAIILPFRANS